VDIFYLERKVFSLKLAKRRIYSGKKFKIYENDVMELFKEHLCEIEKTVLTNRSKGKREKLKI